MLNIKTYIKDYNWLELIKSFLYALVLAFIFRSFIFEPYKIPSGSMIPTLKVGDYLFISKYQYGYSKHSFPFSLPLFEGRIFFKAPQRGDIIVFKLPTDTSVYYIKRLIGLPGDEIQFIDGVLYINGKPVPHMRAGNYIEQDQSGKLRMFDIYEETLPNKIRYKVLDANIDNHIHFPDNTPVYTITEKHYFFIGDNRNNSIDSRFLDRVGFVPEENLVGRAALIFMSADFSLVNFIKSFDTGRAFTRFKYGN